jgi:hypothetical protein
MRTKKNHPQPATKTRKSAGPAEAAEAKKPKRITALNAAARVLAEEGKPMSCGELIEMMAAKKYWTSPAGKTPASTLYSAIMREVNTKAAAARFKKADRGKFVIQPGK